MRADYGNFVSLNLESGETCREMEGVEAFAMEKCGKEVGYRREKRPRGKACARTKNRPIHGNELLKMCSHTHAHTMPKYI